MRFLAFVLWLILLVLSPVVAILALILYPIVWLLLLPLRLVGITVGAVFAFLKSLLYLRWVGAGCWTGRRSERSRRAMRWMLVAGTLALVAGIVVFFVVD